MKKRFVRGIDYREKDADYKSFVIDDLEEGWGGKVVVYGDRKLRNLIIELLNEYEKELENRTKAIRIISKWCLKDITDKERL